MGLYGESIFETNLDVLYNSVMESGKLFEDFNITINESAKDTIKETINKVIKKIREFITWLKTKVKTAWNTILAKFKSNKLKEKSKEIENEVKQSGDSEKEQKLKEFYESEIPVIFAHLDTVHRDSLSSTKIIKYKEEDEKVYGLYYADENGKPESPICEITTENVKDFKESCKYYIDKLYDLLKIANDSEAYFRDREEKFKKQLNNLNFLDDNEEKDLKELIKEISIAISNCTIIAEYALYGANYMNDEAMDLAIKLDSLL